jgi:DNA-binding transcriptional ArsR family regulator
MQAISTRSRKIKAPAAIPEAMRPHAVAASNLLKALANEQRLMILCNLSGTEMSVSELNELLPLSQSALSQHLAVLREAGIVQTRRDGQTVHYSLADGPAAQVVETLHRIYCA